MDDVRIRPVPGFDGYFAGDDGMVYRFVKPHLLPSGNFRDITLALAGRSVHRPLAWFVARAWVGGYESGRGMRVRFLNGDTLDTSPANLAWATSKQLAKERDARWRISAKRKLAEDPDDGRHGTRTGYNLGCKCERCRAMGPVVNRRNKLRKTLKEVGAL